MIHLLTKRSFVRKERGSYKAELCTQKATQSKIATLKRDIASQKIWTLIAHFLNNIKVMHHTYVRTKLIYKSKICICYVFLSMDRVCVCKICNTKHLEEKINYYNRNRNKKILKFRYLN